MRSQILPGSAPGTQMSDRAFTVSSHPITIAPSLLSCDFARIAEEVRRVEAAGGDWHHVDVMDGHFVPNLTIGPAVIERIAACAKIPLDVHLMISDPARYAEDYAKAGASVLTFHAEVAPGIDELRRVLGVLQEQKAKHGVHSVGVALNPDTPLAGIEPILDEIDMVLVMSVFPGFGGQSFIPEVLTKVEALRAGGYTGRVEMDGGLNLKTLPLCAAAGADTLVAGSAIFGAENMAERISGLRQGGEKARRSGAQDADDGTGANSSNVPSNP